MKRALTALALLLAGAGASAGAWLLHRAERPPPLNLDSVVRSARESCAPFAIEGARTDGRTFYTYTCQRELDAGFCPPRRGRLAGSAAAP